MTAGLQAADLVVAPTRTMLDWLDEFYGPLGHTRVILNGRLESFRVGGIALSPEHVYAIKPGDAVLVAIRPERMLAHAEMPRGATNVVHAKVLEATFVGDHYEYASEVGDQNMVISLPSTTVYKVGDTVYLEFPESAVVIWSASADSIYQQGYKNVVSATQVAGTLLGHPSIKAMHEMGVKKIRFPKTSGIGTVRGRGEMNSSAAFCSSVEKAKDVISTAVIDLARTGRNAT